MFLTIAVFVGVAAGGVGFYVTLDLSDQIRRATHESHLVDTEQIASIILSTGLDSTATAHWHDRAGPATLTLLQFENLHIFVGRGDTLHWRNDPLEDFVIDNILSATLADTPFIDVISMGDGQEFKVGAVRHGGTVVGLVRPVSALYVLVTNMRDKMIGGIGLTLFMAILGAWIASVQVSKPLQTIISAAKRIVAGEYGTPIRVSSLVAEFQDLGHHLQHMSKIYMEKIHELEDLTRLQSEFISNISHEVRNPIFAISGFLEALGTAKLSKENRLKYSAKGLLNLKRLSNLFGSLIEIARLDNRNLPLRASRFNLAEILLDTKEMLSSQAHKKDLQLEFDNENLWVYANEDQIRRVFVNLVDNAIRYSSSGTIRCHFQKRLNKARIEITDEGQGIPEEHLSLIFERFHRVDPARSRQDGGSGLGLAIVKQILLGHGEPIHIESILGRGSRFWFELPLASTISDSAGTDLGGHSTKRY